MGVGFEHIAGEFATAVSSCSHDKPMEGTRKSNVFCDYAHSEGWIACGMLHEDHGRVLKWLLLTEWHIQRTHIYCARSGTPLESERASSALGSMHAPHKPACFR